MSPARPTVVHAKAPAKVNLTLRVLGIRADGYHELRTTFQALALHDTLTVVRRPGPFAIVTDDPRCPTDQSNLVWKAAAALWSASGKAGEPTGIEVHLAKRIPSEAGLGGGSSDAAAALRALRAMWAVRLPDAEIEGIARDLGADVAFFLTGGTMLGVERGDLLFPLADAPSRWVVLARPDFGVSTGAAYAWWDEQAGAEPGRLMGSRSTPALEQVNDLEAPVTARHPRIAELLDRLRAAGAERAAMSGSGSAVFGLFEGRADAARAAIAVRGPSVRSWLTRTVGRRAYQRLVDVRPLPGGRRALRSR